MAEEDGQLIGFAGGIKDYQWLLLSDMWIDEKYRRKGIGSTLLNRLENTVKAAGVEHIYLWTYGPVNMKFYEKNGYHAFTVFENFYEALDQIGYRKDL